jgi:pyrrolidone-carboxylate peptidase
MKKLLLLILFLNTNLMANTVVISGFDAFDNNSGNNSEVIGKLLQKKFLDSSINVHYCQLRTVYFKSSEELKDCINSLPNTPDFVIGLGENNCKGLKFETRAKNWMKDISHDNDGIHYSGEVIRAGENKKVIMSLNLKPLYKLLSKADRKFVTLSKNQGSFVCNNLSFIMAKDLTNIAYTFIHVPSFSCKDQDKLVNKSVNILTKTIKNLFN